MSPSRCWILVADEAAVCIIVRAGMSGRLDKVGELRWDEWSSDSAEPVHAASARHARGTFPAAGEGPQQHRQGADFAERVAEHLSEAVRAQRFDALVIMAPLRFLGLLRKALRVEVASRVTQEIGEEVAQLSNGEIAQRLFAEVALGG